MKKGLIALIIIAVIAFGLYQWGVGFNNTAVALKETSSKTWANVESAYQRRNDLIGNLVKTVQGAADFERGTLTDVIEARAKATSISIDPSNITPEQLAQFNQAQSGLSSALSRLLVTVERYPDLKANQNFLELQSQLEGTENRINVARDRFNATVEPYNLHIKKFPNSILAHTRKDHYKRAQEVFHLLKMDNTKQENGVLIYVAVNDRKFVICGDKGIDKVVPTDFWKTTKDTIQSHFIKGAYKEGIIAGVLKAGTELNSHFPWYSDDTNELSNEISKG